MAEITGINTLTLGNTFGTWYSTTNKIIQSLNYRKVASITGGNSISVYSDPTVPGGFTVELNDTINKANVTFTGNVTINGSLSSSFTNDITGINVTVPFNSGVTLGNIVYIDSSGMAQKAKADDECTAEVVGVVIGFTGSTAQVATSGKISGAGIIEKFLGVNGATLQKGVVYFLSEGISGSGTTFEPNIVDYISRPVLLGLTADVGLILPYRGFIANSGTAGSEIVYGVSAGVSSLNKVKTLPLTASAEFLTSGDLVSMSYILPFGGVDIISRDIYTDSFLYPPTNNNYTHVKTQMSDITSRLTRETNGDYVDLKKFNSTLSTAFFEIFSTNGSTFDVWKLKNIKASVITPPKNSISFSLGRTLNRFSCTSYINNENKPANYSIPANVIYLELGSKIISVLNSAAGESVNQTSPLTAASTYTKTILKAKESTLYTIVEGTGADGITTSSVSAGPASFSTVTPTTSGTLPLIYGTELYTNPGSLDFKRALANRVYSWEFTGATFGSSTVGASEHYISKAIDASINNQNIINLNSQSSGVTLDTSILGWNSYYGGLPESLYIEVFSGYIGTNYEPSSGAVVEADPYNIVLYIEMCKYDINTNQESMTNIIRIPVENNVKIDYISGWGPLT